MFGTSHADKIYVKKVYIIKSADTSNAENEIIY